MYPVTISYRKISAQALGAIVRLYERANRMTIRRMLPSKRSKLYPSLEVEYLLEYLPRENSLDVKSDDNGRTSARLMIENIG